MDVKNEHAQRTPLLHEAVSRSVASLTAKNQVTDQSLEDFQCIFTRLSLLLSAVGLVEKEQQKGAYRSLCLDLFLEQKLQKKWFKTQDEAVVALHRKLMQAVFRPVPKFANESNISNSSQATPIIVSVLRKLGYRGPQRRGLAEWLGCICNNFSVSLLSSSIHSDDTIHAAGGPNRLKNLRQTGEHVHTEMLEFNPEFVRSRLSADIDVSIDWDSADAGIYVDSLEQVNVNKLRSIYVDLSRLHRDLVLEQARETALTSMEVKKLIGTVDERSAWEFCLLRHFCCGDTDSVDTKRTEENDFRYLHLKMMSWLRWKFSDLSEADLEDAAQDVMKKVWIKLRKDSDWLARHRSPLSYFNGMLRNAAIDAASKSSRYSHDDACDVELVDESAMSQTDNVIINREVQLRNSVLACFERAKRRVSHRRITLQRIVEWESIVFERRTVKELAIENYGDVKGPSLAKQRQKIYEVGRLIDREMQELCPKVLADYRQMVAS